MAENVACLAAGGCPARFFRGVMVWCVAAPVFMQFIVSLQAAILLPSPQFRSTPGLSLADAAWPLAGGPFAKGDPADGQIARRYFLVYAVSKDQTEPQAARIAAIKVKISGSLPAIMPEQAPGRISWIKPHH